VGGVLKGGEREEGTRKERSRLGDGKREMEGGWVEG